MLGFRHYRPEDYLLSFVIVIPPSIREITLKGVDEKKTDFFGQEYKGIIKKRNEIRKEKRAEIQTKLIKDLHDRILNLWYAKKKTFSRAGAQEFKGFKGEITGKEGLIRRGMTGKRLDFTSRAVLGTDNNLIFQQIGVPIQICNHSYKRLNITKHSIPHLTKLLNRGELVYYFPKKGYYYRHSFLIEDIKKRGKDIKLVIGDEVARRLQDGDDMLMGRNPTIHKLGIMAFKVKREESDTIKLHQSYTTPLNGDFDGDEGHEKNPQSLFEQAECRYVFNVILNIINSENGAPSMGCVMDGITGAEVMTATSDLGYHKISKSQYKSIVKLLSIKDGLYKLNERLAYYGIDKYSTRGIWTMLFPPTYNVTVEAKDKSIIKIRDGVLISGTLTKQNVGSVRGGFVHDLYINYGPFRAAHFINDAMKVAIYYLSNIRGLSIGIEDAQLRNEYVKTITDANYANINALAYNIDLPTRDVLERERRENEIINLLQNKSNSLGQKLTREALSPDNGFRIPIAAGAKGDIFHASQMVAEGGQQYEFGQRIMNDMTDETRFSSYSHPNEHSLESRGYISNSLGTGFNPQDELSHFIATKVTLIDTTTKTADAGDYHHLENKYLLDFIVQYDGSTRDLNGIVVQYIAGYDYINPMHSVEIKDDGMSVPFYVQIDKLIDEVNSELAWRD